MAALVPGTCKKVTKTDVFATSSGIVSVTKNTPGPLESGRTVAADGLAAIGATNC